MRNFYIRLAAVMMMLILAFSVGACRQSPVIGDIVYNVAETPMMALMFEAGEDEGDTGFGVVYRRVTDINRLIASEKIPVLIVFMDGRKLSNDAIAFTEELCDQFSGTARIVRVNVELGDNSDEVQDLVDLFEVTDYPWFAVAFNGEKTTAVSGYTKDIESDIIHMLQETAG